MLAGFAMVVIAATRDCKASCARAETSNGIEASFRGTAGVGPGAGGHVDVLDAELRRGEGGFVLCLIGLEGNSAGGRLNAATTSAILSAPACLSA